MPSRTKIEKTLLSQEEIASLPRAGLWRRMAALLYDMFLVAAIWMTLGLFLQLLFGPNTSLDGEIQTDPLVNLVTFATMVLSAAAFYVGFWSKTGQTLGMIAWRIRVLGTDNRPLGVGQGLTRFFLAWPAFWLLGTGYLWMYIDPQRDAAHERLSRSKTILLPKHARPF